MQTGPAVSTATVLVTQDVPGFIMQALSDAGLGLERVQTEDLPERLADNAALTTLLWDIPSDAVASSLQGGDDAAEIVGDWLDRHRSLLSLLRRNRRRIKLFDARLLSPLANPSDRSRLAAALGLAECPEAIPTAGTPGQAVIRMLAMLTLSRLDMLRNCLDELEANSLTFETDTLALSWLEQASAGFRSVRELSLELKDKAEHAERQDHTLAREKAECVRLSEELANAAASERTRAKETDLLRDQLGVQLAEMARREEEKLREGEVRDKAAYESERALSRALTDLRREARERNALQARLAAVEEERNILTQQMKEIYESRSWRITKPLRQARLLVAPIREPESTGQTDP